MLYADDGGIVSKSSEGLAERITVIVTAFQAVGLTVSERKTETILLRTQNQTSAGQRDRHTTQFLYLGGIIYKSADLSLQIDRRIRLTWACFKRFGPELYDRTTAPLPANTLICGKTHHGKILMISPCTFVYRIRRRISHPLRPIFHARHLPTVVLGLVPVRKRPALEPSRRELSGDVSFGMSTLLVVEQWGFENRPRV